MGEYQFLRFSLALQKPPDGKVVGMKFLSEVLSVTWDIDKHESPHCSFNRAMGFRDHRRCPRTA